MYFERNCIVIFKGQFKLNFQTVKTKVKQASVFVSLLTQFKSYLLPTFWVKIVSLIFVYVKVNRILLHVFVVFTEKAAISCMCKKILYIQCLVL